MGKLVYHSEAQYNPKTVLTVGTFDGVHQGHRSLISTVVERARKLNCRSVLVTFDPHPRDIISGSADRVKLLTTLEERAQILSDLGIDEMIVIPFTRDFSLLSSEEFIQNYIFDKIGVKEFVIGYDHHFGRNREGTITTLNHLSETLGFGVHVVQAHEIASITISSTIVRRKLEQEGSIILAREYLGRPYQLSGTVVHGDKRGRLIGYPTANIRIIEARKIIPKNGVYAVDINIEGDKKTYRGMMNIGTRPTFSSETERRLEVHVIGYSADIYGKTIDVFFLKRLRDEQAFAGLDELKAQLDLDLAACLTV
jgi:riboflavin kinase / FMN adenylyltransferase